MHAGALTHMVQLVEERAVAWKWRNRPLGFHPVTLPGIRLTHGGDGMVPGTRSGITESATSHAVAQ